MNRIIIDKSNYNTYKEGIMNIEKECFGDADFGITDEVLEDLILGEGNENLFFEEGGKLIAGTYSNDQSLLESEDFDDFWNPKEYTKPNTAYISSTAVLPEYQGKGMGYELKKEFCKSLKDKGYLWVIGHAKEGTMMDMNKKFGAVIVQEFPNWYDNGETHFLYEIDLSKCQF